MLNAFFKDFDETYLFVTETLVTALWRKLYQQPCIQIYVCQIIDSVHAYFVIYMSSI